MNYYKAKSQISVQHKKKFKLHCFVENELITPNEMNILCKSYSINKSVFDIVEIPKNNTFISFGVRMQVNN